MPRFNLQDPRTRIAALSAAILLLLALAAGILSIRPSDESAVKARVSDFMAATEKLDPGSLGPMVSDPVFLRIGDEGASQSRASFVTAAGVQMSQVSSLDISIRGIGVIVRPGGESSTAVVDYHWLAVSNAEESPTIRSEHIAGTRQPWKVIASLRKQEGEWLITSWEVEVPR